MSGTLRCIAWLATRPGQYLLLLTIACLFQGAAAARAQDDPPAQPAARDVPRYRLKVGQEFHFRQVKGEDLTPRSSEEKKVEDRRENRTQWWIWVTRKNEDGSWRLLIRKQLKNVIIPPQGELKVAFENGFLGTCDLRPDGSFAANASLGGNEYFSTHPNEIFVGLPPSAKAFRDGWQYDLPFDDTRYKLAAVSRAGDLLKLTALVERPEYRPQEMYFTRQYDFDASRGFVVQIVNDVESKQRYGYDPFHMRFTIKLISVKDRPAAWMASLVREADECLAAQADALAFLDQAERSRTMAECQAVMNRSRDRLKAALDKSQLAEIKAVTAAALARHAIDEESEMRGAAKREALYALPPCEWESTDFDGRQHRQIDYRGKVVLMDFWYRGCIHCVRAMPTIKKVAAHYQGQDVVVLGINVDKDDQDARHVIASCELPYPNLRGQEISKQYRVTAYPTLIVLDQTGRIAGFPHSEYDDLYERVTNVVDELLEHPPGTN